MNTNLTHIFFDLDHTLWDFETNSSLTLSELHSEFSLEEQYNIAVTDFLATYQKVNHKMWDLYNLNKITKEDMREIRFNDTLKKFKVTNTTLASHLNDTYLERCPKGGHLMEGCINLLDNLKERYALHILTNGFKESQTIKMRASGLDKYFENLITSDCSGYQKPHPKMYYYALEKAGVSPLNAIMIGDNLKTDILGAKRVQMATIWFNPNLEFTNRYKGIAVRSLNEILDYL